MKPASLPDGSIRPAAPCALNAGGGVQAASPAIAAPARPPPAPAAFQAGRRFSRSAVISPSYR
eukprot:COSAG01_NODE_4682_length_4820_cov_8.720822_2_plen_63_part_00